MLRCWFFFVVLGRLAVSQAPVKFPSDRNEDHQDLGEELRFGPKYLGYYLSYLDPPITGSRLSPIQTPSEKVTLRPMTSVTLFSAASLDPLLTTDSTMKPTASTTSATKVMTSDPRAPSTFPTAIPTFFPTGIITSHGTFPSIVVPAATAAPSPLITTPTTVCGCLPVATCMNQTTLTGLAVRIVTPTPSGVVCPAGLIYCCSPKIQFLCGLPNIVPGVSPGHGQANLGEFPWSVIILGNDNSYVGGGVLITNQHVLTVTHKVISYGNGASIKVRLGDWDLFSEAEPVKYLDMKIKKITNHPNFDPVSYVNDISVITLENPVPLLSSPRPQINTACLPNAGDVYTGSRCWVAGWGKDQFNGAYQKIIKKVDVPIIASSDCQMKLRATRLGNSYVLDSHSFICAGGEPSKDACTGDGGNALVCQKNGQFYVAGITVGGIECGLPNVPGLYTNTVNYLQWINNVIKPKTGIDPRRNQPSSN